MTGHRLLYKHQNETEQSTQNDVKKVGHWVYYLENLEIILMFLTSRARYGTLVSRKLI